MDAQFNHLQLNQAQYAARDLAQRRLRAAVDHFQGAGVALTAGAVVVTAVCTGPNGEGLRCRFERDGILRVVSKKTGRCWRFLPQEIRRRSLPILSRCPPTACGL